MFLKPLSIGPIFVALTINAVAAQELAPLPDLQAAPQASDASVSGSTLDEPIRQIADTAGGCAILDRDFPGLRQHSMYPFFKSMSLNQIAALSKGQITPDMLAQAKTDLIALNSNVLVTPANVTTTAAATR